MNTCEHLGIRKEQIEPRQAWQDLVESHFRVMKLMALYGLERATTWEEVCACHARFVVDYNRQMHFAHQDRADGLRTPSEVMGWMRGHPVEVPTLRQLFDLVYGTRTIGPTGYIRYLNWRIYGDEALADHKASVWVMRETHTLTIAHEQAALAEYGVVLAPDGRHLEEMEVSRVLSVPSPASAPLVPPAPPIPHLSRQSHLSHRSHRRLSSVPACLTPKRWKIWNGAQGLSRAGAGVRPTSPSCADGPHATRASHARQGQGAKG